MGQQSLESWKQMFMPQLLRIERGVLRIEIDEVRKRLLQKIERLREEGATHGKVISTLDPEIKQLTSFTVEMEKMTTEMNVSGSTRMPDIWKPMRDLIRLAVDSAMNLTRDAPRS